ncbi:MAG: TlpA disulfide reductase family protein [Rhodoferax sp.]|uniref:TlpA family protein disulfide reductase n=1 Tax=Rhodoferax sp. TaxID=50421 RepID=UPI003019DD32
MRPIIRLMLMVCMLGTASWTQAQGFEVVPWPARKPIPALSGTDLNDQQWRLADLKGRAVLLNFWASWCEPCRTEMPSLQSLSQFYGPEKLVVLALNFKESKTVAERYVQRTGLTLPVLLDPDGVMARQWGATAFPTTVLIAADGRVKGVVRGELDWTGQAAARLVEPLLKQEVLRSAQR